MVSSSFPRAHRMKCRLLYLIGELVQGGAEQQLCYLLQAMDRERYRPTVVVWNYCEEDVNVPQIRLLGIPLHSFPNVHSAAKLRVLRHMVRHFKPEVVHSYSFYTNFAAYWATWGTRAVAVGSVRGDFTLDKKEASPWLGRLSARWPRDQIYNSSSAAETCRLSRSFFVPKQLSVVRNGLDLERFRSVPLTIGGKLRIVGIGSLLPVKRWDRLLRVAAELRQRGLDCLIQIVGDGWFRRRLEQQTQDLGVTDCIEFIGYTDNIPDLLADARFLVHTSDSEGCPNVVMEAMACGRAVVATDAGDVPSLVEDGKTGFVIPRGDEGTLLARIVTLMTDHDLCRRMGEAGRVKAEQQFGLDRLVSETLAAYKVMGWKDT
jgi:glycosyltransferase involved in cell wall biosynthesis